MDEEVGLSVNGARVFFWFQVDEVRVMPGLRSRRLGPAGLGWYQAGRPNSASEAVRMGRLTAEVAEGIEVVGNV